MFTTGETVGMAEWIIKKAFCTLYFRYVRSSYIVQNMNCLAGLNIQYTFEAMPKVRLPESSRYRITQLTMKLHAKNSLQGVQYIWVTYA